MGIDGGFLWLRELTGGEVVYLLFQCVFFFGWIQTNCFIEGFVVKATIRDAFESFIV